MPVESATYISQLVATNPVHTDGLAQADSHMRLIKSTLQATFPNITGAMTTTQANLNNGYCPIGGIIIWSGAANAIPTNWQLCDGTNGTPNLQGMFVVGASAGVQAPNAAGIGTLGVNTTGGSLSATGTTDNSGTHTHGTDTQGSHIHSGSAVGDTALTIAQIPPHQHATVLPLTGGASANGGGGVQVAAFSAGTSYLTDNGSGEGLAGGGHNHTLSIATDGAHTHTALASGSNHQHAVSVTVAPIYYSLCYIQRIT